MSEEKDSKDLEKESKDLEKENKKQSEESVELNSSEQNQSEETVNLNTSDKNQTIIDLDECEKVNEVTNDEKPSKFTIFGYKPSQIKWSNVIWLTVIHCLAAYGYVHVCTNPIKFLTFVWAIIVSTGSGFGMSVGGHRLWSHRTFKATFLLRLLLTILQTMTINGSIFSYSRDHRNHHKWPATHADPKNPARGFFFAHMGWWLLKKRPEVMEYGKKVPLDDLYNDPLVVYQHKFYIPLVVIFAFLIPTVVPVLLWQENILTSFLVCCCIRVVIVLHHLFTVNSVAHFWGDRPYDKFMLPAENRIINWISMDYSNSEKTWWEIFNPATLFIDICKLVGLASDLKKPSYELVHKVVERKGLPEYFITDQKRNLCLRICYGMLDWFFGILFAKWPIWPIIFIKHMTGQQLIIISLEDFQWDFWNRF